MRFPIQRVEEPGRHRAFYAPLAVVLVGLLVLSGCFSGPGPSAPDDPEPPTTALATFEVDGETFRVYVESGQTIIALYDLWTGRGNKSIPSGPLLAGAGPQDFNLPWSWHLDPKLTVMTDLVDEDCDAGSPSNVEGDLAAWLATGRYCPSSVRLVALVGDPH